MVHLTTRFAVLAVASLVALNSGDAIALPAHPSQPAIASGTTSRSEARALPLPLHMQRRKKSGQKHKVEKEYRQKHEDAQFARHANQVFFQRGRYSRRSSRRDHGVIIVNGGHDHADHDHHLHHSDDDKIIMNGVGEDIYIKDRRSSSSEPLHNAHSQSSIVPRTIYDLPRRDSAADEDSVESGAALSTRDAGQTQNVTLVFTPSGPKGDSQSAQEEEDSSPTLVTVTETVTSTVTAPSATAAEDQDSSPTLTTVTETVTSTVTASSNGPTATAAEDRDSSESEVASNFIDPSSSSTASVNALKVVEVFASSL